LTACLQFLDFFATGTQRTAVTTAANCCRNIPHDSFPVIRDVMPILQNVLASHDQKVVEQGCLCVTRVIDSFKHSPEKLEQLVDAPLLKAVLGLLLPGTVNLIGAGIHTEFLRVLAIIARASPRLSVELLKMNVVDTLYQILTGVSPPSDTSEAASKIDSVVVMQALIHRPREQVYETLNVICELLPRTKGSSVFVDDFDNESYNGMSESPRRSRSKPSANDKRLELLENCKLETRRFAMILFPTLTDAYSSTVNLNVRQKVLTAQLKMLSNLDTQVIEDALRPVPYASFLASILSQEDHPSLVMFALRASEILFERLENIYQYQFYREGVIAEIKKLADRPLDMDPTSLGSSGLPHVSSSSLRKSKRTKTDNQDVDLRDDINEKEDLDQDVAGNDDEHLDDNDVDEDDDEDGIDDDHENDEDEDDNENENDDEDEDEEGGDIVVRDEGHVMSESPSSDSSDEDLPSPMALPGSAELIIISSKQFLELYETSKGNEMRAKAASIRQDLQELATEIEVCYLGDGNGDGRHLFAKLAKFFDGDALESITSSELLSSGIIRVFLEVFGSSGTRSTTGDPEADFLVSFGTSRNSATAFSILIHKLQDLLSRAEHFEVLTVNNSASESSRNSSTSMLSKQLRLKLTADADSDIPPSYRDITVSIHAIATFKALDDYLRPRISLSERPPSARRRDMLAHLANARMRELSGLPDAGLFPPGMDPGSLSAGAPSAPKSKSRSSSKTKPGSSEKAEAKATPKDEKPAPRRSSKRSQPSTSNAPPESTSPTASSEAPGPNLECADEKHIEEEPDTEAAQALEAIVDDLEEDMSDDDVVEPSAVNMEIASTGKVTARKEDGTRVATPLQPGTPITATARQTSSSQPASAQAMPASTLAMAGRPFSYAAALASIPQDWHIEFSMEGKPIPKETTIYRAVYHNQDQPQDPSSRNIWSGIHAITFKRVKGPPPASTSLRSAINGSEINSTSGMPASLDKHPTTSSILSLLSILHEMNANLDNTNQATPFKAEPLAQFINTKLTAKMNRQLEEPLIVASNCLPGWSEDLARLFPFLFPFETRHLFLQSTSFGYSRSMMRWQSNQSENDDRRDRRRDERPLMGRLQRQKVRISRTRILESAVKVMEMYGASPSVLEVEYFEEVGTGLGPTLEFYSTVSKEFSKKKLKLWRENESEETSEYAFGKLGLFPAPMSEDQADTEVSKKLLHFFKMMGKFVARSMLDSRIIDISFNPTFFRLASDSPPTPALSLVKTVDNDLASSLAQVNEFVVAKNGIEQNAHLSAMQKVKALHEITIRGANIEDLMLDFTLPGYPSIELIKDGSNIAVTIDNLPLYVERVLDLTLGSGVRRQIEAFQVGFSQVFSYSSLKAFTPNELVMLFGRVEEDWTIETLMDSIKADHGFNMDSKSVKNLLQTMSELSPTHKRDFLQFVTGSPKLPIGGTSNNSLFQKPSLTFFLGFKSLTPMFTVVCKPSEPPYSSDDYLPSVMTCVNYLKLPDYTNLETLRERLNVAIQEGQGAFHLS
jgi:E3 ubiquitin-protein ligase TRIP12